MASNALLMHFTGALSTFASHESTIREQMKAVRTREENLDELARWTGTPDWAIRALRRGIAVHHAGMNKAYRTYIETRVFSVRFEPRSLAAGCSACDTCA